MAVLVVVHQRFAPKHLAALDRIWYLQFSEHRIAKSQLRTLCTACAKVLTHSLHLPEGYEVMLGNGGSTAFWDIATFGFD